MSDYLRSMKHELGDVADAIWGNCAGYPAPASADEFRDYIVENNIVPHLSFAGYPDSETEILASMQFRHDLAPDVVRRSAPTTEDLERAWRRRPAQRPLWWGGHR